MDKKPRHNPLKYPKAGRPRTKHGGYSLVLTGQLPQDRKYLAPYLTSVRERAIRDLGGEDAMTATQLVMVDRLISALGFCRLIEEFCREKGVFDGAGILQPALSQNYIAYSNQVRMACQALGILSAAAPPVMSPLELAKIIDAKTLKRRARDIPAEEDAGRQATLEAQRARAAHAREAHMKRLAEAKAQAAAHAAGTADPATTAGAPTGQVEAEALVAELEKDKEGSYGA